MVSNVAFKAISTDSSIKLKDSTVKQVQSSAAKPAASKNIYDTYGEKKKSGFGKFIKVTAFLAVAGTILLGLLSHKGVIGSAGETGEKALKNLDDMTIFEKYGQFIAENTKKGFQCVKQKLNIKSKNAGEVVDGAKKVVEKTGNEIAKA